MTTVSRETQDERAARWAQELIDAFERAPYPPPEGSAVVNVEVARAYLSLVARLERVEEARPSAMLAEFHAAVGHPETDALWLRRTLHDEEHEELVEALEDGHISDIARELADVVYVAFGTACAYGIDLDAALAEVHRANMHKATAGIRREDGKVVKPPDFVPPDMSLALPPNPEEDQRRIRGGSAMTETQDERAAETVRRFIDLAPHNHTAGPAKRHAAEALASLIARLERVEEALEQAGPDPVAMRSMAAHVVACWNQLGRCEDEFNPDPGPYCGEYAEHLDSAISAMAGWLDSHPALALPLNIEEPE